MNCRHTREQAMKILSDKYGRDDYSKIELRAIQEILNCSNEEIFAILNSDKRSSRLCTNLEEEYRIYMDLRKFIYENPNSPEHFMEEFEYPFYREIDINETKYAYEYIPDDDYETLCKVEKDIKEHPRNIDNLTVRYIEFYRFAMENPDYFWPNSSTIKLEDLPLLQRRGGNRRVNNERWKQSCRAVCRTVAELIIEGNKIQRQNFRDMVQRQMPEGESALIEACDAAWDGAKDYIRKRNYSKD